MIKVLPDQIVVVILPMHGELASGTVESILCQASLTIEELWELGKI